MTLTSKLLLVLATIALAACNNPRAGGTFGGGGADGFGGAGGGFNDGGISTGNLGDPNDPNSIAHFQQRIGDRVFFTVDSSSLNDEARSTLNGQARWLSSNPQFAIVIEGHADERGTREYNVALGERRANAVMQYLVSQGISANRLRTVSYGKERPVEACAAQRCWDVNRRSVTAVSGVSS
ncbi:peptidoglycan-associated lipoprotein [Roseinatronobacter thiooxidans]|jgi:peptidoglycan-associated lipoprotein|uniref:Peptidoglycan-associated lipoprotein n=1 Tax=Roseinatronobacter thiooxidans TaxID=121821 RepID=A0A2W7RBP0_9RHOB|nr:peptidoglycan-associated lipoprotein Pal [Roseinatronobacter thiooxidans]PZX48105.1 peptidoglycan-associated lipoprotein [Roseinatronobacter thiooxidans]